VITGTMTSERIGNARIWTLTVPVMPRPGQLIEWNEPACGSMPAMSGVRGWVSGKESTYPETVLVTVAGYGERWVKIAVPVTAPLDAAVEAASTSPETFRGAVFTPRPLTRDEACGKLVTSYGIHPDRAEMILGAADHDDEWNGIRLTVLRVPGGYRVLV